MSQGTVDWMTGKSLQEIEPSLVQFVESNERTQEGSAIEMRRVQASHAPALQAPPLVGPRTAMGAVKLRTPEADVSFQILKSTPSPER